MAMKGRVRGEPNVAPGSELFPPVPPAPPLPDPPFPPDPPQAFTPPIPLTPTPVAPPPALSPRTVVPDFVGAPGAEVVAVPPLLRMAAVAGRASVPRQ